MEILLGLFGGGLVLFVVFPLAFLLFVVLPWWALIDVIRRQDNSDTRVLWGVALVLLWGLASIVYALFSTHSRGLRRVTVACLVGAPLAMLVGFASLTRASRIGAARDAEDRARIVREFTPRSLDVAGLRPVVASRPAGRPGRYQVGLFRLDGPDDSTLRPVDAECDRVTLDTRREQYYCLSWRSVTRLDFDRNLTTEIAPAAAADFGHLGGATYDAKRDRIVVVSNSGSGGLFSYDPGSGRWEKLTASSDDLDAVTWSAADDSFYAVERVAADGWIESILRYNAHGARIGEIALAPEIPLAGRHAGGHRGVQLIARDGWLYVVLTRLPEHDQPAAPVSVLAVDPASGAVYAEAGTAATLR